MHSPDRSQRLARVESLLARQAGLLARRQLTAVGWTDGQIQHEIDYGRWRVPVRGVVATTTGELSETQRAWLGVLYAGSGAALSHLSAARAAGLRWIGDERVHVVTPKGDLVPRLPGFVFHQTRRPYERWLVPAGSVGPPRLRLEEAVLLTAERDHNLRRAIGLLAASVQQGLTTAERLEQAVPRIRKLRHGQQLLLALGDVAGGADSFAEIDAVRLCESAGLRAPVRQVMRLDKDGRRRWLDLEWNLADGRIIVLEVDGGFHRLVENWWKDKRRERHVVISGRVVLRCASIELRLTPGDVLDDLRRIGVPRFVQDLGA